MDYKQEKTEKRQIKNCLRCGRPVYGRADKVFCGEECKNKYHNVIRQDFRRRKLRVVNQLDLNYEILRNVIVAGADSIPLSRARELGFRTEYCTTYTALNHGAYMRCYDIEYCISRTRLLHIHRVGER